MGAGPSALCLKSWCHFHVILISIHWHRESPSLCVFPLWHYLMLLFSLVGFAGLPDPGHLPRWSFISFLPLDSLPSDSIDRLGISLYGLLLDLPVPWPAGLCLPYSLPASAVKLAHNTSVHSCRVTHTEPHKVPPRNTDILSADPREWAKQAITLGQAPGSPQEPPGAPPLPAEHEHLHWGLFSKKTESLSHREMLPLSAPAVSTSYILKKRNSKP